MNKKIFNQFNARIREIENQLNIISRYLKNAPEGHLLAYRHRKSIQYNLIIPSKDDHSIQTRIYVRKDRMAEAQAMAQKEYCIRAKIYLEKELALLRKLIAFYKDDKLFDSYYGIPTLKHSLIHPLWESDEVFRKNWEETTFEKKKFSDEEYEFITEKGERVRSKSELLIANLLHRLNIPYRYECALKLRERTIYPDFTILDIENRKEIYYEHFGMMDDQTYSDHAIKKIYLYEKNGFYQNDRLFMTFETRQNPLNLRILEHRLRKLLLIDS